MVIYPPTKIYLKESKLHGYGVFAKTKITKGEIIDTCPFLSFPQTNFEKTPVFGNYTFSFPRGDQWTEHALVLGYGSYYNHSNKPNANWSTDIKERVFTFFAIEDIEKDEEILTDYANGTFFYNGSE
jgi:uncharacterized protein